ASNTTDFEVLTDTQMCSKRRLRMRLWPVAVKSMNRAGCLDDLIERGLTSGAGDDRTQISGVKLFTDGSLGAGTALLSESYLDDNDNFGVAYTNAASILEIVGKANAHGLRAAVHAIGDAAIDIVIEAFASLVALEPTYSQLRNRIEHFSLPSSHGLKQLAELDVFVSVSAGFLYELGDSYLARLEPERLEGQVPVRMRLDVAVPFRLNIDCPVIDPHPYHAL